MARYMYGMKYRGFSLGCQPRGVVELLDGDKDYYDIIVYDRELTDKEIYEYELDYIGMKEER